MISSGSTVQFGRSGWATPLRPGEQLLSSMRTFLMPKMLATTSLDSMCATGIQNWGVTFEFNCCAQVSGGPLLPGKQSFREAGRPKEGGGSAEDEGEIQPEHSCPLTHPDLICTLSSTLALFLKSLNHLSVVFGRFSVSVQTVFGK